MPLARAFCLNLLLLAGVAPANPMPVEAKFYKRLPNSERREIVKEANFDDDLCFSLKGFASDGEHVVEVTIFDASGREVARMIAPVLAEGATWRNVVCYGFKSNRDVPGQWWYVANLDDLPVASESINIAFGKPKPASQSRSRNSTNR
jgi:hypothetical protein